MRHALSAFPSSSAGPAARALDVLLGDRAASGSWYGSSLTGDGFPVEFAFTTADARLRYTVEPGSVALGAEDRFDLALQLLKELDGNPMPPRAERILRPLTRVEGATYGAWVGGRHDADGEEYKIYTEVPLGDAPGRIGTTELPRPRLPDRIPALRMLAYSLSSAEWEAYYRIDSLHPHHLPRVLEPAGLHGCADELQTSLTRLCGRARDGRLPGPSVGVSYTLGSSGHVSHLTLFFFARAFWGTDAAIRNRLQGWARTLHWDDGCYQQLTTPLAGRRSWQTYHGILGVTVAQQGVVALSVGVRPIEVTP